MNYKNINYVPISKNPLKKKNGYTQVVSFMISPSMMDDLKEITGSTNQSVSGFCRKAIEKAMQDYRKGLR